MGRADLVFEDRHGRLLIVEVKRGKLPRGAIDQLLDYFGMMKHRFPDKPVELMVVANVIPAERRLTCENRDIECREINERTFREVAAEVGYKFASEASGTQATSVTPTSTFHPGDNVGRRGDARTPGWAFNRSNESQGDVQDFLSRCDEKGKTFFTELFDAQKTASNQTRITWKHESGFSLQFYFHRVGFAPLVWGFPASNRDGRSIRQRLEFPFDFSQRAGVPEAFIHEFGASLSSLVAFLGGGKRPNIPINALQSDDMKRIVDTIFSFVAKAASK